MQMLCCAVCSNLCTFPGMPAIDKNAISAQQLRCVLCSPLSPAKCHLIHEGHLYI